MHINPFANTNRWYFGRSQFPPPSDLRPDVCATGGWSHGPTKWVLEISRMTWFWQPNEPHKELEQINENDVLNQGIWSFLIVLGPTSSFSLGLGHMTWSTVQRLKRSSESFCWEWPTNHRSCFVFFNKLKLEGDIGIRRGWIGYQYAFHQRICFRKCAGVYESLSRLQGT